MPNSECSRHILEMQELSHEISCFLTSVVTVYFLKCLTTKYFIFLQVIRVFKIFVNRGSMTSAEVYQGSTMTKRFKSTSLDDALF